MTFSPSLTDAFSGFFVISGTLTTFATERTASEEVLLPALFLTVHLYFAPLSASDAVKV